MGRPMVQRLKAVAVCACLAAMAVTSTPAWGSLAPLSVTPMAQIKAPRAQVEIELKRSLPGNVEQAMTYRIVYPKADLGYTDQIAAKLGMSASASASDTSIMARDGRYGLEVYPATGAFWYSDMEELWSGKRPAQALDEAAGRTLAEAALRSWDLLPEGMLFESTGQSQLTAYDVETGTGETFATDLHVNYRLSVNGLPVEGPGGKVKVYLGEGYRIIGLYWAGFRVEAYREYPIMPPAEALATLTAEGIATTVKDPVKATVTGVNLVYYAGPGTESQSYLEPVYCFHGEVQGPGESQTFRQYVPAIPAKYRQEVAIEGVAPSVLPTAQLDVEERTR